MAEGKGLAIAALGLGILGLFTAGGLIVGSLLGLALAGIVLLGRTPREGRDVAGAAIAANLFALLSLLPLSGALLAYRATPFPLFEDDDALPVPAQPMAFVDPESAAPPAPPPPPPTTQPAAVAKGAQTSATVGTGPAEAKPVRVGGAIREPRKTRHVNPVYPKDAIQARVQGVVILECTISAAGEVVDVKALRGVPLLTEAAIDAVRQWQYTPTLLNGVAVPVIMTVTVNFKLS